MMTESGRSIDLPVALVWDTKMGDGLIGHSALAQYWRTPAEFIIRLGGSHVNQWKAQTAHIQ